MSDLVSENRVKGQGGQLDLPVVLVLRLVVSVTWQPSCWDVLFMQWEEVDVNAQSLEASSAKTKTESWDQSSLCSETDPS